MTYELRVKSTTESDIQSSVAALQSPLVQTVAGIDTDRVRVTIADADANAYEWLMESDPGVIWYAPVSGTIVAFFAEPEDGSQPDWDSPTRYEWVTPSGMTVEADGDDWERASKGSITSPYEERDISGKVIGWHVGATVEAAR